MTEIVLLAVCLILLAVGAYLGERDAERNPMLLEPVKCERCGCRIEITPGATAVHASCPNRTPRGALPKYRPTNTEASK